MTEDRNLWQDAHNEDCPNLAQVEELKREVEESKEKSRKSAFEALMQGLRASNAERRLAVYNTNGFSDSDALADKYLEVVNELASLRTSVVSGEWIDCRDRLPPMNPHNRCADWDFSDRVEVVSEGVVCIGYMATEIHNGETNWISESGERLTVVNYWKNLPAIPKPIEREG
jgi:hypothetical protein